MKQLASAMKVNAWLCAFATDRDLEIALSRSINLWPPKTVIVYCVWRVHGGVVCSGKAND